MVFSRRWKFKLDRLLGRAASSSEGESNPGRPRLCPACRTLVGSTATRCHECGASVNFSLAAASRFFSTLIPGAAPAIYSIATLNFLLFAAGLLTTARAADDPGLLGGIHPEVLQRLGASLPLPYDLAQPWRLVMAIFLHGGLLHIAMNSWVLLDIGPQVEEMYGSARCLFLYVLTGVVGFLFSSFGSHFSVGASGALTGLVGVLLAATTGRGGASMQAVRGQLTRWVIYILAFGLIVPGIDNLAHIGGLAAGFLLGRMTAARKPETPGERQRAYALGWLAGLAILASFLFMILQDTTAAL